MKNIRKEPITVCYNRDVTFLVDDAIYAGTIQNVGNYGVAISARSPIKIPEGKKIWINMLSQNQKDVKSAEIIYSDESGFGAKFI
jgi:hypothetical protein